MWRVVVLACAWYGFAVSQPAWRIDTIAGTDSNGDGGQARSAIFINLEGVAVDPTGNVYVADTDAHCVRRISPNGLVRTYAGMSGRAGFSGDAGPAAQALLNLPYGLAADLTGNLYIADYGNARVRKVSPDGIITTVAGHTADTQLTGPRNVATDTSGSVFVSDFAGHRIYRIAGNALLPVAGTGKAGLAGEDVPALSAPINAPAGLAVDMSGAIFFGETGNKRVRRIFQGTVTTVGPPPRPGADPTLPARLPTGVAVNFAGELFIADSETRRLYKISRAGIVEPLLISARDVALDYLGNAFVVSGNTISKVTGVRVELFGGGNSARLGGDGGDALLARLNMPTGIARDSSGNLFFTDSRNHRVRRISTAGQVDTVVDGMSNPGGLAVNAKGWIYVADTGSHKIRVWKPDLSFTVVAGTGVRGYSGDGALGTSAMLSSPSAVALDAAGNVYFSDEGNNRVRVATPAGIVRTLAVVNAPAGVAFDEVLGLFVIDSSSAQVLRISPQGTVLSAIPIEGAVRPRGIAVDPDGTMYIADAGSNRILRVTPDRVTLAIAGTGAPGFAGDGGLALLAQLQAPAGVLSTNSGILIADTMNHRIRMLARSTTIVDPILVDPIRTSMVWNAASRLPAPLVPGGLFTVPGLADQERMEIQLNGAALVPVSIGPGESTLQAPADLVPGQDAEIVISSTGVARARIIAPVAASAPGLYAKIANEDGSINSTEAPAVRGNAVSLFLTGEGQLTGPVEVMIAGRSADVLYAGSSGVPGILQVNAVVPAGYFPSGAHPVLVLLNGKATQAGVNLVVR